MIRGNIFKNWNKTCYIANKISTKLDDYGNEVNYYSKPKKYKFNIQPANGNFEVTLYGEKVNRIYKAIVPMIYKDQINEGDIAYLDGNTPTNETEESYGSTGNYIVDSVRPQNLTVAIYFRKLNK